MTGRLRFYDAPTAWGVIAGDDGQLYMVRGLQMRGLPLREGDRVRFEPVSAPGGRRAANLKRIGEDGEDPASGPG
jgi:cold shock CspA family protein